MIGSATCRFLRDVALTPRDSSGKLSCTVFLLRAREAFVYLCLRVGSFCLEPEPVDAVARGGCIVGSAEVVGADAGVDVKAVVERSVVGPSAIGEGGSCWILLSSTPTSWVLRSKSAAPMLNPLSTRMGDDREKGENSFPERVPRAAERAYNKAISQGF